VGSGEDVAIRYIRKETCERLVALEKVRSLLDVSSVSVVVVRLLHAFSPTLSIGPALDVLDARSVAFVCVVYNGSNHLARRCGRLFRTRRVAPTGMDMQSDGKEAAACRRGHMARASVLWYVQRHGGT
jgi:hypothetical protein